MGIRLKVAQTAAELDDVYRLRHQVYTVEEGRFSELGAISSFLVDRYDTHPNCANLVAYDGDEAIGTMRLNLDDGNGLPSGETFDFSDYRRQAAISWNPMTQGELRFISAGMLAVRKDWRKRRDVIRALFRLATGVADAWGATHVLVVGNHENALMYKRVAFSQLNERLWVEAIGNYVVPMAALYAEFRANVVGPDSDRIGFLGSFAEHFQRAVFRTGEAIFRQGDVADECYLVDTGSVKITGECVTDGRELTFAVLGKGEVFGELALIDKKPRSANATATTDTEVIILKRADFLAGIKAHPERLEQVLGFISERLRRTDELAMLLAYGSDRQKLEFALGGFLQSAKVMKRKEDGTAVLRAGPADLATAAGTDITTATRFLDELYALGYCEYTSSRIHFLTPDVEWKPAHLQFVENKPQQAAGEKSMKP